jgi:putative hydrolase
MLVDFHCHTHFSLCGCHSLLEVLAQAKKCGIQVQAITDHGPTLGGHIPTTFFDRFRCPYPAEEFTLLKGMECNLLGKGKIDVLPKYLPYMDLVLLGIHPNTPRHKKASYYTRELIAALQANPYIDVLTHLNTPCYPVDFRAVVQVAVRQGVAIELNNSKTNLQRAPDDLTQELIKVCQEENALVAINTDAHCLNEIANDAAIQRLLQDFSLNPANIVTRDAASALAFVQKRKACKPPLPPISC